MLYELPVFSKPYSLSVSSLPRGVQTDMALFIPRVAMYDSEFKPARYFDEKTLRNRGDSLERTIFMNSQNSQERYIAIFGSDMSASIERAYSAVTVTPIVAGPFVFNMYSGHDGKSVLQSSATGVLQFEVHGLDADEKK